MFSSSVLACVPSQNANIKFTFIFLFECKVHHGFFFCGCVCRYHFPQCHITAFTAAPFREIFKLWQEMNETRAQHALLPTLEILIVKLILSMAARHIHACKEQTEGMREKFCALDDDFGSRFLLTSSRSHRISNFLLLNPRENEAKLGDGRGSLTEISSFELFPLRRLNA